MPLLYKELFSAFAAPQQRCEEISIEHCQSILPYSQVYLPNTLGQTTQAQVNEALLELDWLQIMASCRSNEFASFICSLYLPSCEEAEHGSLTRYVKILFLGILYVKY